MGDNAAEGIFIGVYIFIFVVALSATITLFTMINNYAELSYEYGKQVADDASLIENVPTETHRVITGSQLISYICNYTLEDEYVRQNDQENVNGVNITYENIDFGTAKSYKDIIGKIDVKGRYTLIYNGTNGNKINVTIKKIQ